MEVPEYPATGYLEAQVRSAHPLNPGINMNFMIYKEFFEGESRLQEAISAGVYSGRGFGGLL